MHTSLVIAIDKEAILVGSERIASVPRPPRPAISC